MTVKEKNQYEKLGFKNRQEYLESKSDEFGVGMDAVNMISDLLGPEEDFDGLISSLQDAERFGL